jgi:hypothetical protein
MRRCTVITCMLLVLGGCSSKGSTDDAGAVVVATSPADGAANVATDAAIEVVFDKAIDPATLAGGVTLSPERALSITWDADTLTATVQPAQPLATEVTYQLRVTASVTTPSGAALRREHSSAFSVRVADTCAATDTSTLTRDGDTATVQTTGVGLRSYTLQSTASLRDNLPAGGTVSFSEQEGQMLLRSGHELFDALFALALEETRQNSVTEIADGAFDGGAPTPCDCFETGEKWTYVWTRDTAYATHLALALVDPSRARRSLEFKLSARKTSAGGGDVQIVQDTGSGGSYPVSTDRVVWAHGAREVLAFLDGTERTAFRDLAYEASVNTIEQDRLLVFDDRDGLYRGEQSFLDWREQSYPRWMSQSMSHIAMSRSLSTNVGHLALLRLARDLAGEKGDETARSRYADFADQLEQAIRTRLIADDAQPQSMVVTELAAATTDHRDLLGESLAALSGVFDGTRAVASYPRSAIGSPVIWPQLPDIPIYHNRGMWPFVSAYSLLSARAAHNPDVFGFEVESLVSRAALNLSNMENFDFANGNNYTDAGSLSGPVVNSRRQLWSVAGYLAMVTKGIFGLEAGTQGIRFRPTLSGRVRRDWFGSQQRIALRNISYRGHTIDVELILPDCTNDNRWFEPEVIELDGVDIGDRFIAPGELGDQATITIAMREAEVTSPGINTVSDLSDPASYIAPREPTVTAVTVMNDHLAVAIDANGEPNVTFDVIRDGVTIASGASDTLVEDTDATDHATTTRCYAVRSRRGGLASHVSPPLCYWGESFARVTEVDATALTATGGTFSTANGRPHYQDWGDPGHLLELPSFQPAQTGSYYLQLIYANGSGPIDTGITAAAKWVEVRDTSDDSLVTSGLVTMPQNATWTEWTESTLLRLELDSTRTYRVVIGDSTNMSYFEHFARYDNTGGGAQPYNRVNITAMRFLAL